MRDQSNWSAYGKFMYKLCDKWGMYMAKHQVLFNIISYTWGCIMTTISIIVTICLMFFCEPIWYHMVWYMPIGKHWGGLELGVCFLVDKGESTSILQHELGHCVAQASLLGPFFIFLVWIPSAIRYWWDEFFGLKRSYYDIWFEASASETGKKIVEYLEGIEND